MACRNSRRSGALPLACGLLASAAFAACATAGIGDEHGPVFTDASTSDSTAAESGAIDASPESRPVAEADTDSPSSDGTADAALESEASSDGSRDAKTDASDSGDGDDAADEGEATAPCTSTMALLAIGGTSIAEAIYGHGQWSSANTVALATSGAPSLVAFGTGYLGAFVGTGTAPLEWTAYTGSWSAPAQIASALAKGNPALAVTGATAHVVYWGTDDKYYHGIYSTSWDGANDPVGSPQSFGPSGPGAAGVGTSVLVAQSGQDGTLYDQVWTGSWAAATAHPGAAVVTSLSPVVVALQGGLADAMIVYVAAPDAGGVDTLQYTVRTSGTWSTPTAVFDETGHIAFAGTTPSLAALAGGGAILTWLGSSPAYAYVSTYSSNGWTAPVAISADTLASPPSVASGVCGSEAVVAYVATAGGVSIANLSGGAWTTPVPIAGASGLQSIAIATTP